MMVHKRHGHPKREQCSSGKKNHLICRKRILLNLTRKRNMTYSNRLVHNVGHA